MAKKKAAKKKAAMKKGPARKKASAKKKSPAKKSVIKKAVAKKSPAKKTAPKKMRPKAPSVKTVAPGANMRDVRPAAMVPPTGFEVNRPPAVAIPQPAPTVTPPWPGY